MMVKQLETRLVEACSQPFFCHGHANGVTAASTQRAGCGFYAGCVPMFWMAWGFGAKLAELL